MLQIYITEKSNVFGYIFKSKTSIKDDLVSSLPYLFVTLGIISEDDYFNNKEKIVDKFDLCVIEKEVDGRDIKIKKLKYFSWLDYFKSILMIEVVDGYLVDTTTECIKGHFDLNLKVGEKYEIHYGIHQGIHEYIGKISDRDTIHIHARGQYLFRNLGTKQITFGYYGNNSPYEFTSIVTPLK